jgi:hypothetical protein
MQLTRCRLRIQAFDHTLFFLHSPKMIASREQADEGLAACQLEMVPSVITLRTWFPGHLWSRSDPTANQIAGAFVLCVE